METRRRWGGGEVGKRETEGSRGAALRREPRPGPGRGGCQREEAGGGENGANSEAEAKTEGGQQRKRQDRVCLGAQRWMEERGQGEGRGVHGAGVRLGAGGGETWTQPEREMERRAGSRDGKSKGMETQGERWTQGGKPNARERGAGGRDQAMGETVLETGPETEIQEEGKGQGEKVASLCTWEVTLIFVFLRILLIF